MSAVVNVTQQNTWVTSPSGLEVSDSPMVDCVIREEPLHPVSHFEPACNTHMPAASALFSFTLIVAKGRKQQLTCLFAKAGHSLLLHQSLKCMPRCLNHIKFVFRKVVLYVCVQNAWP